MEAPDIVLVDLDQPKYQQHVLALHKALQGEGFTRHGQAMPEDHRERLEQKLIPGLRSDPAVRIWIAYQDDAPIAIAQAEVRYSTWWCANTLYVQDLWVQPEFRKRGIARTLIMECMYYAKLNNLCRIELTTTANNPAAGKLYQQLGFSCADIMASGELGKWLELSGRDSSSYAVLLKHATPTD